MRAAGPEPDGDARTTGLCDHNLGSEWSRYSYYGRKPREILLFPDVEIGGAMYINATANTKTAGGIHTRNPSVPSRSLCMAALRKPINAGLLARTKPKTT